MTRSFKAALARYRRFRGNEDGGILVIEFVILVPILFFAFLMSVEMGLYSMRRMFLDRGVDVAVRHIRLNTATVITHDQIKQIVCDNAGWLEDCNDMLRLEMTPLNPRNFAAFPQVADCVDTSQPATPVRGFNLGREHQLVILRACVRFEPVFPSTGLGYYLEKDGSGRARMYSTTAFVQEPG